MLVHVLPLVHAVLAQGLSFYTSSQHNYLRQSSLHVFEIYLEVKLKGVKKTTLLLVLNYLMKGRFETVTYRIYEIRASSCVTLKIVF